MNKKLVFSGVVVFLLVILGVCITNYMVWNKPDKVDISTKKAIYKLDAKTVIDLIETQGDDSVKADQIIEIEGIVKKISYLNDRITILLGANEEENAFVICDMQDDQAIKVKKLSTKDSIKLKGVFKGFLEDAIFLNCVISE